MACFTNVYIHDTSNSYAVASCQVNDDIWLVQKLPDYKLKMDKWNINTKEWKTVDFKNRDIVEIDNWLPENTKDFSLFSSDGHLYMWKDNSVTRQLLRFDTLTYEWTLILFDMRKDTEFLNSVVVNNKVYINSNNKKLCTLCMDTRISARESIQALGDNTIEKVNLCKLNGMVYIIRIRPNGIRAVYYPNDATNTFRLVNRPLDQRNYLIHTNQGMEYKTFAWSHGKKLYHAIFYEDTSTLIIDSFDMETKCFTTIFKSDKARDEIINISGTDKEVYVAFEREEVVTIQVIDLKPTLETLSLMSLVDNTSADKMDSVRNILPVGLRIVFDNLIEARQH